MGVGGGGCYNKEMMDAKKCSMLVFITSSSLF
jgi:hypothetical protein